MQHATKRYGMIGIVIAAAVALSACSETPTATPDRTKVNQPAATTGRTIIVDRNHPKANDANSGAADAPLATIHRAATLVKAGDTVCVMAGDYPGRVTFAPGVTGAEGRRIVFRALPRHSVRMGGFATKNCDYLTIEGFSITPDTKVADWKDVPSRTENIGVWVQSNHVDVIHNRFNEVRGFSVTGDSQTADVRVAYNRVWKSQFGINMEGERWVVECNEVVRLFDYGALNDCDYVRPFGRNQIIRYNFMHGSTRQEVGQSHTDHFQVFALHNLVAKDILVEQNVGFDTTQFFMGSADKAHAQDVGPITFRKNVFDGGGWAANGINSSGVPKITSEYNTLCTLAWHGIRFSDGADGGRAFGNIVYDSKLPLHVSKSEGCTGDYNLTFKAGEKNLSGPHDLDNKDPLFVNPEKKNYRLKKGSPAIGAAEGGRTIGALEYPNVYYVDPAHPGADDQGFGYAGWPFRTVAAACAVAEPGETIVLRGGTYRETIVPKKDGVAIRATDGERAVVSGADLIEGWTREADESWTAPVAAAPKRVLKDGAPFADFTYDDATKHIRVKGFDPRMHCMETVVRAHGLDGPKKTDGPMAGIEIVHTLDTAVAR